ncbi:MAG: ABC-2 family transporter protein [Acutalibacteraceae bacterium]|nr:ABC-2 family transporter protein [Acutalibacteraceae bacterium]
MFKTLRRMIRMHRIFIAQDLKKMMEYKIDFLTGAVSFLLGQAVNIAFLWIIFSQIPQLKGWEYNEIIFIYGFSLLPKALDHLFCDNLWMVGYSIVAKGDFDKYLTRPINPLFTVIVERFQVDALGELIVGIALIASTIGKVSIQWSILNVILFLLVIPFATLIFTSIKTATAAIAFWTKRSGQITHVFYMVNDFAKYPTTIYNNFIKTIITYIIPFAFTAFYPASYFLTGENPLFNIGLTIVMSCILMVIAVLIWNKGVSAYESAGS